MMGNGAYGAEHGVTVVIARIRSRCLLFLFTPALVAGAQAIPSRSAAPRYIVTASPIDLGTRSLLCVAVDPLDKHGIWWWEPGRSGCSSRSTGPGVFEVDQAVVSQSTQSDSITLSFRLQIHSQTRPDVEVRLVVTNGEMRRVDSDARVPILRRSTLDVPEMVPEA
jgi:hypothetical protein